MDGDADVAAVARLLGEPARARMCMSLMHGRSATAGELARVAGVARSTASEHLSQLEAGGLLEVAAQGRHRYFRLANAQVAEALESLSHLAPKQEVTSLRQSQDVRRLRDGRTCYDHLAGRLGMDVTHRLMVAGVITDGFELGDVAPIATLRLQLPTASRRPVLRACLDWTERQHHAAGALPAVLTERFFELGWIERVGDSRAVRLTSYGARGLDDLLPAAPAQASSAAR